MATPMQVEMVSPDGIVWEGQSVSVTVTTQLGPITILSNHEPILAGLEPCAVEIVTIEGRREVIAVEGGFFSVFENHISILSDSAQFARDVSLEEARRELAEMKQRFMSGAMSDDEERRFNQLTSQVRAGEKFAIAHDAQ